MSKDCPKRKCPKCGKRHHELLHYEGKKTNKVFSSYVDSQDPLSLAFAEQDSSCDEAEDDDETHQSHVTSQTSTEEVAQSHHGISEVDKLSKKDNIPDISLRVLAIKIKNHISKKFTTVNVLLDEGADRSYIDESVAKTLQLRGAAHNITLNGAGGKKTKYKTIKTLACVTSLEDPKVNRKVLFTVLPSSVGCVQYTDWKSSKSKWEHLDRVPTVKVTDGPVVGIIGGLEADLLAALEADVIGPTGGPVARRCKLGWTILGRTNRTPDWSEEQQLLEIQDAQAMVFKCVQTQVQLVDKFLTQQDSDNFAAFSFEKRKEILDSDLNEMVKKQMEIESLPDDEEKQMSRDDLYAQQVMNKTMRQLPDGRYECGALWKKGEPQMPNNLSYAMTRHKSFISSPNMQKASVKAGVEDSIADWLKSGFIRKVPPDERWPKTAFYLPIFVVARADSETTKYRVVTDGKAEFRNFSLNKAILAGPCWIKDVTLTLSRFRRYSYAMMGDVSKMFLQVQLAEKDRVYHRFLWTPDPKAEPDEYEFQVHCFGNAGSPSVAISVVRDYAKKNAKRFPRASEAILNSTHVDDTLDSFKTLDEAIQTAKEIQLLYSEIKMKLRKFASNSKEFMEAFDQTDWASDYNIIGENQTMNFPTKKALGIVWNTGSDTFSFPSTEKLGISIKQGSNIVTKRIILKELSRLFDPLGFISPVLIKARLIQQQCWKENLDWDEQVTKNIEKAWLEWLEKADELPMIKLPRVLIPTKETPVQDIQLHTFCDASEKAYGFVTYIRVEYQSGEIYLNLVASKAKIAPMEEFSIPRLELEAAVLGARMTKPLATVIKVNKIFLWTDSTNVIWWIRCTNKELKKFVSNRQKTILKNSETSDWRHVGTHENPADIVSRGTTIGELRTSQLWWKGPDFLAQGQENWPTQAKFEPSEDAKKEMKPADETSNCFVIVSPPPIINIEDYSSWTELVQRVALIIRMVGEIFLLKSGLTATDFPVSRGASLTKAENWLFQRSSEGFLSRGLGKTQSW
jgi:hypothetical protein